MSFFRKVDPADAAVFEGEASLSAIADAARDTALYADNFNSREYARSEAFDEAIANVREATGIELKNPMYARPVTIPTPLDLLNPLLPERDDPFASWNRRIDEIAVQHPDKAEILRGARLSGIEEAARGKARAAERLSGVLSSTREGVGGPAASLLGGFKGALRDPATIASLPFGLGAGGARTIAGKILSTAWREALVSGSSEAALQPVIQKWRGEAGLEAGLAEGLKNVGAATVLGGLVGGGLRGAIEVPGAVRRGLSRRTRIDAPSPSAEKLADDLLPLRDELPPAARAAVDVFDQERAAIRAIRNELGDDLGEEFARLMDETDLFAERVQLQEAAPDYRPEVAPKRSVTRPASLTEFLAREGLKDEGGELAAMDLDKLAVPGSGKLVRKNGGVPLDRAREAAAEAGYIHGYGSRADAVANSTVDDLVNALREEQAGRRIFALGDEEQAGRWHGEGEAIEAHRAAEEVRREIFDISGGHLTPDESARAFRLVEGGMDPEEAVERVILYDDTSVLEAAADPFEPGSAEFTEQVAGLEGQVDLDDELADLLFVDEAGAVSATGRTVGEALEEAERGHALAQLVEACRLS